jgi:BirA family biotin operon repressor/biotin-[acetyl-CoA-carboxylase] ligase
VSRRTEKPFWDPDELQNALTTHKLGRPLHLFNRISSTNEFAKRIARRGAPAGTLVLADAQSSGRGRLGRSWDSPPDRGLWFSFVMRTPATAKQLGLLPLLVGAVIVEELEGLLGRAFHVKWPNDVLAEGKKICGILCEAQVTPPRVDCLVVGIGLNVNQSREEFPLALQGRAQSLSMVTQKPLDRKALLVHLLHGLDRAFFSTDRLPIEKLQLWKNACKDIGTTIALRHGREHLTGVFETVSEQGELMLRRGNLLQRLSAAEFSVEKNVLPHG